MTLSNLSRVVLPALQKEGFEVPSRAHHESSVTACLGALPVGTSHRSQSKACTFVHLVNLLWLPLLEYVEDLVDGAQRTWTASLETNHAALVSEMAGIVLGANDALPLDDWLEVIRAALERLVATEVPHRLLLHVLSPIVPLGGHLTPAMAMHVLRSSVRSKCIGASFRQHVNRLILSEVTELPVVAMTEQELNTGIKKYLVASLVKAD